MPVGAVVLQARLGSRRLPGKVLAPLGGRTLLAHAVRRLSTGGLPIVVATTCRAEDAAVAAEAVALGAHVFRGEEDDVLGRFVDAARAFGLDLVVRATADNPFVDGAAVGRVFALATALQLDHVVECGLPVGAAVEAVRVAALERAAREATDHGDREHVTTCIRQSPHFTALRAPAPADRLAPDLRLTVDTAGDLAFARALFDRLGRPETPPDLPVIIGAAQALETTAARVGAKGEP